MISRRPEELGDEELVTSAQQGERQAFEALVERYKDRKSTRLNSSHIQKSRMPSSA